MSIANRIIWIIGLVVVATMLALALAAVTYRLTGPHYIDQTYLDDLAHCEATIHHHCV